MGFDVINSMVSGVLVKMNTKLPDLSDRLLVNRLLNNLNYFSFQLILDFFKFPKCYKSLKNKQTKTW